MTICFKCLEPQVFGIDCLVLVTYPLVILKYLFVLKYTGIFCKHVSFTIQSCFVDKHVLEMSNELRQPTILEQVY